MTGGICSYRPCQAADGDRAARGSHGRASSARESGGVQREALRYRAQSRQDAELKVTTDDGDTVKISIRTLERLRFSSLAESGGAGQASYTRAGAESRMSVSIDVEGSLNQEEAADIAQLMKKLAGAVEDLRQGGTTEFAQAAETGLPDSLASFGFAYRERSTAAYSGSMESGQARGPRLLRYAA